MSSDHLLINTYKLKTKMAEDAPAIVLDCGSGMIKAGFTRDDAPRAVFSTVVGKPKTPTVMIGFDQRETIVGHEAQVKRSILKLDHPIQRGVVKNWDDMEKIL
jgi:actin, other eukaryote